MRPPWPIILLLVLAYGVFGTFSAWLLVTHDYETEYLGLGRLAVEGILNLYQDEMTGQWMPLPFYVYGPTQVVFGPTLIVPRLLSLAIGGVALVLMFALASRWCGMLAGITAVALLCTHGGVIGDFSTVQFASLVAVCHLGGLYLLFCVRKWWHRYAAMLVFSTLFLIKPNYWVSIPFVLVYLLWTSQSLRERLVLIGITALVPAVFFVSDVGHLKVLAYVPFADRWVEPLGYRSVHALLEDPASLSYSDYVTTLWPTSAWQRLLQPLMTLPLATRRFGLWLVLFTILLGVARWRAGGWRATLGSSFGPVMLTMSLFGSLVLAQFVVMGPYAKQAIGYVGPVTPLFLIVLACLFAKVWEHPTCPASTRVGAAGALILVLMASPWIHRSANLPRRISLDGATVPALRRIAGRLQTLIPPGEHRVFLLGDALVVHLADRRTYLRQFHQWWIVFTSLPDSTRYARAGMWGPAELELWLGQDAQYAIVRNRAAEFYRKRPAYDRVMRRMEQLLAERFVLLDTVTMPGGEEMRIYGRKAAAPRRLSSEFPADRQPARSQRT